MTKKKNRKRIFWLIAVVCLGAGVAAYFYYRKREVVLTVQTEKVSRRNITELVVANGRIQPVVQVVINPEVREWVLTRVDAGMLQRAEIAINAPTHTLARGGPRSFALAAGCAAASSDEIETPQ